MSRQAWANVPASPRLPGKVSTGSRGTAAPAGVSTSDSPGSNWPCSST